MRDILLAQLKQACATEKPSVAAVLNSLDNLLAWLVQPENNTNKNCRAIDLFVTTEIWDKVCRSPKGGAVTELPESVCSLIFDVGGQLHDTHTAPEVAVNFESTPEQLLMRTRKLKKQYAADIGSRDEH